MNTMNTRQVAFSPIEYGMGSYEIRQNAIERLGVGVIRFPRYSGDPDENIEQAKEILARTGGLLLNDHLSFGAPNTLDQSSAILDRIYVANQLRKPVFVPSPNWLKVIRRDVREEQMAPVGVLALTSASGIPISCIFDEIRIVPTGPHDRYPYAAMIESLDTEALNLARGE
jgi:hypothetical protein